MTPDNNNENSRMENILTGMLNNTPSSELPKAHSRVEELLLQVLDKMNAGGGGGGGGAGSMMVEVTNPDGGGYEYRMNKTAAEIYEAFTAGMTVICHFEDRYETKDSYGRVNGCSTVYSEGALSYYSISVGTYYGNSEIYSANNLNDYPHVYYD